MTFQQCPVGSNFGGRRATIVSIWQGKPRNWRRVHKLQLSVHGLGGSARSIRRAVIHIRQNWHGGEGRVPASPYLVRINSIQSTLLGPVSAVCQPVTKNHDLFERAKHMCTSDQRLPPVEDFFKADFVELAISKPLTQAL